MKRVERTLQWSRRALDASSGGPPHEGFLRGRRPLEALYEQNADLNVILSRRDILGELHEVQVDVEAVWAAVASSIRRRIVGRYGACRRLHSGAGTPAIKGVNIICLDWTRTYT